MFTSACVIFVPFCPLFVLAEDGYHGEVYYLERTLARENAEFGGLLETHKLLPRRRSVTKFWWTNSFGKESLICLICSLSRLLVEIQYHLEGKTFHRWPENLGWVHHKSLPRYLYKMKNGTEMSWVFTSQWDQTSPQNQSNNGTLKSSRGFVPGWNRRVHWFNIESFPGSSGFQRKMNEWMNKWIPSRSLT